MLIIVYCTKWSYGQMICNLHYTDLGVLVLTGIAHPVPRLVGSVRATFLLALSWNGHGSGAKDRDSMARNTDAFAPIARKSGLPEDDRPVDAGASVAWNRWHIIAGQALQNAGDQVVKASTVLTWLLAALGSPAWAIGLLVPVRESGSMLPQAALTPWVRRRRQRKWVWVAGAAGQAVSVAAMAVTAAIATGATAGVLILLELAAFALSRALTSIASKDVLGRAIPKGQRGDINGIATLVSGVVAVTIGLGIRVWGGSEANADVLAWLLGAAALAWIAALAVYARIREPVDDEPAPEPGEGWFGRTWTLLADDAPFRRFVIVRALLLVSALSPPFVVSLAAGQGGAGLSGLGPFVIASGLAGIIGGRPFGRLADRSSRTLMVGGAAAASAIILALLAAERIEAVAGTSWLFIAAYFLLTVTHTGVRVARKTYVVDMATGDQRTEYVAVSNTAMGVLLLVAGAISSALAQLGPEAALLFLAGLGLLGVLAGRSLAEVSLDA